jgi:hypothetical protein
MQQQAFKDFSEDIRTELGFDNRAKVAFRRGNCAQSDKILTHTKRK